MVGYTDIKNYLERHQYDSIGQFGIDWIEDELESWLVQEEGNIFIDDETARLATHYRVETVLEVLRADARCRQFFEGFRAFLEGGTFPAKVIGHQTGMAL